MHRFAKTGPAHEHHSCRSLHAASAMPIEFSTSRSISSAPRQVNPATENPCCHEFYPGVRDSQFSEGSELDSGQKNLVAVCF